MTEDISTVIQTSILELEAGVAERDVLPRLRGIVDLYKGDHGLAAALAIDECRTFLFLYAKGDEVEMRMISPWTLEGDLLFGYDHDRQAVRTFRIDRILGDGGAHGPGEGVYVYQEDQA